MCRLYGPKGARFVRLCRTTGSRQASLLAVPDGFNLSMRQRHVTRSLEQELRAWAAREGRTQPLDEEADHAHN